MMDELARLREVRREAHKRLRAAELEFDRARAAYVEAVNAFYAEKDRMVQAHKEALDA